jgi:hypothetical protein
MFGYIELKYHTVLLIVYVVISLVAVALLLWWPYK